MRWACLAMGGMICALAEAAFATGACERIVVTGNPEYPPVVWADPDDATRLTGAAIELLELALDGSGVKVETLNVGPWARAQEEARDGRVDMLASAFMTMKRLGEMDYVHPPYMEVPSVVFVKRGASFAYSGWNDLRDRRGSTAVDTSFGSAFDTYAKELLNIEQAASIEQSFRQLLAGRVDYVVYERHRGLALAERLGLQDQLDILDGSVINEQLYFTISHNSACNSPALRGALAQGMHRLVNEGVPRRILEKYRDRWTAQYGNPEQAPASPVAE